MPFHPGFIGRLALTLSKVGEFTSNAISVTISGVNAGDLIVFMDCARNNVGAPAAVVPSGYTQSVNFLEDSRMCVSYKIAAGGETSIAGMNGGVENRKAAYVFRGSSAIKSVSVSTPTTQGTTGNPNAQTVAASGGQPPLVIIGCYHTNTGATISTRTFTVSGSAAKDGEITPTNNTYLAYKIDNSSPLDASIDMNDEGDNMLASFYVACTG